MSVARLEVPDAFRFLWTPSRYKAAWGGRGTAKSHTMAAALIMQGFAEPHRVLCCREIQNSIADSSKQLLDDKIREAGLTGFYSSTNTEIVGANGTRFMFAGLKKETINSIKSKEGITRCWVDEAQSVSQGSLDKLIPTIRVAGSEIWFSWNPETEYDAVDQMFRGKHVPPDAIVRHITHTDNPWFPEVLRTAMEFDRETDPEKAAHIWDGGYKKAPKGAYFAKLLASARSERRIGNVPADPILETHVAFDLGNGPNMAMVFAQFVGREIRIIETMQGDDEASAEGWPWYIRKLREKKYIYGTMILPHDARIRQRGTGKGDEAALIEAKFRTRVVDRMDPGERVKLVQRMLPVCWIDESKCSDGLKAWTAYRADLDELLGIDRGPLHDWSSHMSSALGHLFQAYDQPREKPKPKASTGPRSWMS